MSRAATVFEKEYAGFCGFYRFTNRRVNDQRMRKAADQQCRVLLKREICVGVLRIISHVEAHVLSASLSLSSRMFFVAR